MNAIRALHAKLLPHHDLLIDPRIWLRIAGWNVAITLPLAFIGFMTLPLSVSPVAIGLVPAALGLAFGLVMGLRELRAEIDRREAEPHSR